jgi:hypothetical protein
MEDFLKIRESFRITQENFVLSSNSTESPRNLKVLDLPLVSKESYLSDETSRTVFYPIEHIKRPSCLIMKSKTPSLQVEKNKRHQSMNGSIYEVSSVLAKSRQGGINV